MEKLKADVSLYWVNDMGRNGYYDQKPIAELMGRMALSVGPEAVIAVGDIHHFNGVQSTSDPLWMTNYELVYSNPELMCFWYPVLGNHEYRGNTQAVLDYAKVSRRWAMPARYYSKVFSGKDCKLRIVFIDTTPLMDCYRNDSTTYPDAHKQDRERELAWLDSTLTTAHEDWVICVGHHPIYAQTPKKDVERADMQNISCPCSDATTTWLSTAADISTTSNTSRSRTIPSLIGSTPQQLSPAPYSPPTVLSGATHPQDSPSSAPTNSN